MIDFNWLERIRQVLLAYGTLGINRRDLFHKVRSGHKQSELEYVLACWHKRRWVDKFTYMPVTKLVTQWRATTLLYTEWPHMVALAETILLTGQVLDVSRTQTPDPAEASPPDASNPSIDLPNG